MKFRLMLSNVIWIAAEQQANHYYFYYQGNKECDFVIQQNEQITSLIQVTWDMTNEETQKREIEGLLEASQATGCTSLFILTNDEEREITESKRLIKVMPVWKWALL